ncbi:LysM peptidoglycan-binding domain-containing protein [Methylotenera sp. G11]|uniref:LysM peptidoglycan-binding domain-containing protein n=1 Tax=Methylotenera sp. G11 TaxID=1506585 RepID=UPI000ACD23C2|nr:LysM peptidoglycan-binding domain-containing protein [Methylotenera sp. G11]
MNTRNEQSPAPVRQTEITAQKNKYQLKPSTDNGGNTFVDEGKANAITVNTPFTVIPGLPALNKILAKIDRSTQQDLGFTFKASAEKVPNPEGTQDLQVSLDYIGFGLMSSRFNVQFSPLSVKIESGNLNTEPHWGCSATVLSSPIGLVHERAGVKGTFSDCNGNRTFSAAPEFSYQSSKTFRPLSTATGGYFFGNSATFNIPDVMLPIIEKVKADGPSLEEWEIIANHALPSIPAVQIGRIIDQQIEVVSNIASTAIANIESVLEPAEKSNDVYLVKQQAKVPEKHTQPQDIKPAGRERTLYTVQQNDTLSMIGKKTGHTWMEIFALNKNILKNEPDRIYPGQELRIPNNHEHIALMEHPVIKAQILANLAKHNEMVAQNTNNTIESAA